MLVLGFDGMDPILLQQFMDEGVCPNLKRLAEEGGFERLGTSIPPQSPVAWSNFITGRDPGGHGIFDFIHRNPETYLPYLSTARTKQTQHKIHVGKWEVPLGSGSVELLRRGRAFWELLEEAGVPATIVKIPANFPPAPTKERTLSGMGTPDILGTYGTFSYYTDHPPENADQVTGGVVVESHLRDGHLHAKIEGPPNTFRTGSPGTSTAFDVYADPSRASAKFEVQGTDFLLNEGEWSDWVKVEFETLAILPKISGICRFYLQEVRPRFRLYVTPVNLDPADPALPISTPEEYSEELAEALGGFYTQGMPGDTKALEGRIFDNGDYLKQSDMIMKERVALFRHELASFQDGLLFVYFGTLDQNCHMFWRAMDDRHPAREKGDAAYAGAIRDIYRQLDAVVGEALEKLPHGSTLLVMSDHGFAPWYRAFHLNSWLRDNGYLHLLPGRDGSRGFLQGVDWRRTRAYGLGINGLYLNMKGREGQGIVADGDEREKLLHELKEGLLAVRDPKNGHQAVKEVYITSEGFEHDHLDVGPDIIVGYARTYRGSNESALGGFTPDWFSDNLDRWSGDHSMAASEVPGVVLCNRAITHPSPDLKDLAPTILAYFGVKQPDDMHGRPIFEVGR
jgi:predicted AlkP superfamily phosphohydrolase/phosphomutase